MDSFILNFGPQHPAAHGVLRLLVELSGERIVSVDPHIGFLHRGTEKLIETKTYLQSIPYFDRLDYVSMLSQEHGFVLAVEKLLNINISVIISYIRVMFDEITRILNHIMCITTHALDIGALTPFLWGFEEREHLLSFYEKLSGSRMHAAYYRVGGLAYRIPKDFLYDIYEFTIRFINYIDILEDILSNNPIWISRLKNIGFINKKDLLSFSVSGPVLRGSGIPWDLRKLQPYEIYKNLNFNIPTGLSGDSYSRYYVRMCEMRESNFLIQQCLNFILKNYTDLSVFSKITRNQYLVRNNIKTSMESLINHFKYYSEGTKVPKGSVYSVIEAPKGETGVYIESDGSSKPVRCKIKSPGYLNLQTLNLISKNHLLSDLVANIGSLDIVFGEIDR